MFFLYLFILLNWQKLLHYFRDFEQQFGLGAQSVLGETVSQETKFIAFLNFLLEFDLLQSFGLMLIFNLIKIKQDLNILQIVQGQLISQLEFKYLFATICY